jgi:predicted DNA-binding transcriptional regulator AlpA
MNLSKKTKPQGQTLHLQHPPKPTEARDPQVRLMSRAAVLALIDVSYPRLWTWVRDKHFPAPISLGPNGQRGHIMWIAEEVEAWVAARARRYPKGSKSNAA